MRRKRQIFLGIVISLVLIAIPLAAVSAKIVGVVVVSGPGIDDQLTIVDYDGMLEVQQAGFFEVSRSVDIPSGLGEGFRLSIHTDPEDLKNSLLYEMEYHPMPDGQTGYVKMLTNGGAGMVPDGRWFQFPPRADEALRGLLSRHRVDLNAALVAKAAAAAAAEPAAPAPEQAPANAPAQPPIPVTSPPANPIPTRDLGLFLAVLAGFVALAAAAAMRGRRSGRISTTASGED